MIYCHKCNKENPDTANFCRACGVDLKVLRYGSHSHTKTKTIEIRGVPFEMVFVKGGTFSMGYKDLEGNLDEQFSHEVELDDFYIGKYPVTQLQWKQILKSNREFHFTGDDMPATSISYADAKYFLLKINEIKNHQFQLPTEAQWEYAAKGGAYSKGYKFAGSNNAEEVAWCSDNMMRLCDVGMKKSNELGIFDMSGNVSEWCNDFYEIDYYKFASYRNPQGPQYGKKRVLRGGSYRSRPDFCSSTFRRCMSPSLSADTVGFRLVCSGL